MRPRPWWTPAPARCAPGVRPAFAAPCPSAPGKPGRGWPALAAGPLPRGNRQGRPRHPAIRRRGQRHQVVWLWSSWCFLLDSRRTGNTAGEQVVYDGQDTGIEVLAQVHGGQGIAKVQHTTYGAGKGSVGFADVGKDPLAVT